jgi:hypothetical protein
MDLDLLQASEAPIFCLAMDHQFAGEVKFAPPVEGVLLVVN